MRAGCPYDDGHMGEPTIAAATDVALRVVLGGEATVALVIEVSGRDALTIQGRLDDLLRLLGGMTSRLSQLTTDLRGVEPPWEVQQPG